MKILEPSINQRLTLTLFKKAVAQEADNKNDSISLENLTNLFIHYKIAGFGNFIFGTYLEKKRPKYKEMKKNKKK